MTNFDMIKNMSVEEMAETLLKYAESPCEMCNQCQLSCIDALKNWLNSECEVGE